MPKQAFTDAYNADPAYGDTDINGEEIIGIDPDTGGISKGIKLIQLFAWLMSLFDDLYLHDHPYIPQLPTATNDNIAVWLDGDVIDSGIGIASIRYKTIGVFIEKQLSDPGVEVLRHPVVSPFVIETDAVGSQYSNGTSPAATAVFVLKYDGAQIGTMSIDTLGAATFVVTQTVCNTGGVLTVEAPTPADTSIANVGLNLRTLRV